MINENNVHETIIKENKERGFNMCMLHRVIKNLAVGILFYLYTFDEPQHSEKHDWEK